MIEDILALLIFLEFWKRVSMFLTDLENECKMFI